MRNTNTTACLRVYIIVPRRANALKQRIVVYIIKKCIKNSAGAAIICKYSPRHLYHVTRHMISPNMLFIQSVSLSKRHSLKQSIHKLYRKHPHTSIQFLYNFHTIAAFHSEYCSYRERSAHYLNPLEVTITGFRYACFRFSLPPFSPRTTNFRLFRSHGTIIKFFSHLCAMCEVAGVAC